MKGTFDRVYGSSSSVSHVPTPAFITDMKEKRNAICDEWPGYLTKNKNIVIINKRVQMKLQKDADPIFL